MEPLVKNKNLKVHMVSHVHWDPMWYSSFQEFRIRLYRFMKRLLSLLENNHEYKYFMLDGQVQIVDDYLEVAPEDEEKIRHFIKSGRLYIGPWYVQPEEFLISGETHIRNLKMGMQRAEELGGSMKVSYLCDPVGHIAQLPQLIKGFGMDYFVATRGIFDNDRIKKAEFFWEAPDGSRVLVHSAEYYNYMKEDMEAFKKDFELAIENLVELNQTEYILYLQGWDHAEAREEIPEFVKEYNLRERREFIIPFTLEEHMKAVEGKSDGLYLYKGELRNAYLIKMLDGILTTRMEIKLKNAQNQINLEKWAEPFSTVYWQMEGEYPETFLNLAWKIQVTNSFHDCIYGAHADHITQDVMNNYKQADEIIRWETNEALYGIAGKAAAGRREPVIVFFNPSARDREDYTADFDLYFDAHGALDNMHITNEEGESLPYQVNSQEISLLNENGNMFRKYYRGKVYKYNVSALVKRIPAAGYTTFVLRKGRPATDNTFVSAYANGCENKYLKLEINGDGTVDVTDKTSGKKYAGLNYFYDAGDRGDEYNFSATVPAGIIVSKGGAAAIELLAGGSVKAVFKVQLDFLLPEGLETGSEARSARYVNNKIICHITLKADSRCVEFHTVVDNVSEDHKLAVVFPTGIHTQIVNSGSQFCVLKRDIAPSKTEGWCEKPGEFRPHQLFVQIHDADKSFTFMDKGLTEHKVTENGDVYITLLRCTGYLSKDTLPERGYGRHAGPPMETPLGQQKGRYEYDYSLYFHEDDWEKARSYEKGDEFNTPVKCVFIPKPSENIVDTDKLPEQFSFLKIDGEGVVLSALKKGAGSSIIVRLYNIRGQEVETEISFFKDIKAVWMTDLAEKPLEKLQAEGKILKLKVPGNKIVTLAVEFTSGLDINTEEVRV